MALTATQVQSVYVAFFNRPADPSGLRFWMTNGTSVQQLFSSFNAAPEYTSIYSGLTLDQTVNKIYQNLFGRAADLPGLNFWVDAINNKAMTLADAAYTISQGAVSPSTDFVAFESKTKAAVAFTDALNTVDLVTGYTGTSALALAKAYIASVTDAATLTTASVTNLAATVTNVAAAGNAVAGQTYTLTTGLDTITGTAGNDTINGILKTAANADGTYTALDNIDAGNGTDTLNINDLTGGLTLPASATVKNVEKLVYTSAGAGTIDTTSNFTGLTSLTTAASGTLAVTAKTSTDVSATGNGGTVTVNGGQNVTATNSQAFALNVGQTTANAGTITTTSTAVGATDILVDGGTAVSVTASGSTGGANWIKVGQTLATKPSGAVTVTSNHTAVAATDASISKILVTGGSTIAVTQTADTSKAATDTTGSTLTQGAVTVTAGTTTTSATVTQAASTAKVAAVTAVAGVTETASVKFSALAAGETMVMGGLTYTVAAGQSLTAAEAAAVFANLVNGTVPVAGDPQGGGAASKGTYTGVFTGWTSGAVSTDTVVFTSTTASSNVTDLANTGTAGKTTITTTAGSAATDAVTGVLGVIDATVVINDNATAASLTSVTVNGYGTASTIGATNNVSKLATLSLANSGGKSAEVQTFTITAASTGAGNITIGGVNVAVGAADSIDTIGAAVAAAQATIKAAVTTIDTVTYNATTDTVTVTYLATAGDVASIANTVGTATGVTFGATAEATKGGVNFAGGTNADMTVNVGATLGTLALNLNAVKGPVTLTGAALKTLNVTTATADSSFALTAAAAETLTVDGSKKATFSADLAALKTVTVTGSASLALSGNEGDTLTSVTTTGTTGTVSASIDGTLSTYTGGAGADTVTLVTGTALTKAIDLGAGSDTLSFAALNVTGSTATLSGGDGTDTLSMASATADALDASVQTFYTNFERLLINDAAASTTVDLANLGFANYVTSSGSTGTLTLNNLANNGTVVLTKAPTTGHTITIKDAATGTADVLNLTLSATAGFDAKTVTAANIETINITASDTSGAVTAHTISALTADKATTITVSGNAGVTFTALTGSTKVTVIDGSTATGKISVTSLNTTSATTIKGGSAADTLTAATGTTADVLLGGGGDDTLTPNAGLTTMTGGTGNDVFKIATASSNSSSYSTITDFSVGDLLVMTGANSFTSAKVNLASTAVFQDYVNAAINAVGVNGVTWFQFTEGSSTNTYVVMDLSNGTTFANGTDYIVKLTGAIDLTSATFNNDSDTIALPGTP